MKWRKLVKTFPRRIFLVALILRLIPVVAMRNIGVGVVFLDQWLARSENALADTEWKNSNLFGGCGSNIVVNQLEPGALARYG